MIVVFLRVEEGDELESLFLSSSPPPMISRAWRSSTECARLPGSSGQGDPSV